MGNTVPLSTASARPELDAAGRRIRHAGGVRSPALNAILVCAIGFTASLPAGEPIDYSAVEPIFTQHCLDCHGAQDPEAKLVMETHELLMKGGESGAVIIPGKSEESLLLKMIEGKIEKDGKKKIMPPGKREKLTPDEIARIKAWIDGGAKPPAEFKPRELIVPKIEPKVPPRNSINALAYAPARKLIAMARYAEVELRSAETRAVVRVLRGHRGNVNAVAFSPDGRFLFAAGGEAGWLGEVRQWDLADGGLFYLYEGYKDAIYSVAVSPDGKTLATGSYDQKIKLWNIESGEEIKTLSGHNGAIFGLAFRPDGGILASASADRTVKLWDATTGERRDTLSQPLKEQYALAFSPDGKRLAAGGVDNRIRLWRVSETAAETTNPILESRFAHEGAILNLVFASDGATLLSSADDRTVKLWDAAGAELKEKLLLEKQPDWPPALAFALENKAVVVGRVDGTIEFYDAAGGKILPPPKPELTRAEPRGVQRGKEIRVLLQGSHFAGVTGVKSHDARLTAELVNDVEARPNEIWINVTTPGDLPRGAYELSAVGPNGESGKIKLHVDDLPQVYASGSNKVQRVETLPVSIWAAHEKTGDADQFDFEAKAGQTLVFDLAAKSLGSKADAVLTLLDAAGKVLASNNGFDNSADPFLAYTFRAAGQYRLQVSELLLGGSPEHFYRLSIGAFPHVTGCYPLSVPAGAETEVALVGYNLPAERTLRVKAGATGEMDLPLDAEKFRSRRTFKLIVGEARELVEIEPNDTPDQATKLTAPCAVAGRVWHDPLAYGKGAGSDEGPAASQAFPATTGERLSPSLDPGEDLNPPAAGAQSDVDLFRFEAKAGQTWVIETQAAQRGSPLDTKIEVLHADGRSVERLLLQAVRDTFVNFRGVDSNNQGMRLENWEEMELNEFVYLNGEVIKIFRMPQGPDSDMLFYGANGKRRAYFDSSAIAHALDEQGYIVTPHPPGAGLVASGLPILPLYYSNDDDGEHRLGTDSKLFFTAPADGAYLIRVTDTRGYSGDRFAYRLVVREPKPDFKVTLGIPNSTVNRGSGQSFTVTAERFDGFEGEIRVNVTGLPPGFTVSTPLVIQEGHTSASGIVHAAPEAAQPSEDEWSKVEVTASARVEGRPVVMAVNSFGKLKLGDRPKLLVFFEPNPRAQPAAPVSNADAARPLEITITPGQTVPASLKIQRNGHDDLVTFTVENLPHGVIVDNIGLNGVLIPKGESEREIFLTAAKWVGEMDRWCYAIENQAGRQTSLPVLLKVRKPGSQLAASGK